jgi:hypothetical protein
MAKRKTTTTTEKDPQIIYENWLKTYWRPAMAWQYFLVCAFDFILFPLMHQAYLYFSKIPYVAWEPITMSLGGMYHISMAAIVGIATWTRGQEKLRRIDDNVFNSSEMGMDRNDFDNNTRKRGYDREEREEIVREETIDPTIVDDKKKKG